MVNKLARWLRGKKVVVLGAILLIIGIGTLALSFTPSPSDFTITDELDGNIFPSAILSVAATDDLLIQPADTLYVGNPKSRISVRVRSGVAHSRVRVEVLESAFFAHSVSEFMLDKPRTEYRVYPDIAWNYEALRDNKQPVPVSVVMRVELNGKELGRHMRTFSVRSLNECLLGFTANGGEFYDTSMFFAAYVNEENPLIDKVLREALDTRIVNRFPGYQVEGSDRNSVDKQVFALWSALRKRDFRYSSVSNSSLSSNIVYTQRVRTLADALESSQINCVDGSVLFASLLRAINIDPVLVRTPGHMFVGYYTDASHQQIDFLETTLIGDADHGGSPLDAFEQSKAYAREQYSRNEADIHSGKLNYMFMEISKDVRRKIQPF